MTEIIQEEMVEEELAEPEIIEEIQEIVEEEENMFVRTPLELV